MDSLISKMELNFEKTWAIINISLGLGYILLSPPYYRSTIALYPLLVHNLSYLTKHELPVLPAPFWTSYTLYLFLVFGSLVLYRISPLHPLHRFPGPFLAKINKWYYLVPMGIRGTEMLEIPKLHEKYGDWVRIGPNDLSIRNVEALTEIYSHKQNVIKGHWYDCLNEVRHPSVKSLLSMRERTSHKERRSIWERVFTTESLCSFRPILRSKIAELIHNLDEIAESNQKAKMSDWFSWFQIDMLGELSFSGGFQLMKDKADKDGYIQDMDSGLAFLKPLGHLQFVAPVFFVLPEKMVRPRVRWTAEQFVKNRKKKAAESYKDLYYYLLDEEREGMPDQVKLNKYSLYNDASLAIIAGGGTTSTTLTYALYDLLRSPSVLSDLRAELDQAVGDMELDDLPLHILNTLPLLNACINETLRIHPPVASGLPREIINSPLIIQSTVIPVGTTVSVPFATVAKDERYFDKPNEFRPERWLPSRPKDETFNVRASQPFTTGPYSCVGKNLAWEELRTVLTVVLRRYDFKLSQEFSDEKFLKGSKDYFTIYTPELEVHISRRK
ncbi:cytochrome P450 [Atractiella rhizophila]|nr:cytochrome P450 [Atractiella rhizophila]